MGVVALSKVLETPHHSEIVQLAERQPLVLDVGSSILPLGAITTGGVMAKKVPLDPRSTQRKRARKVLFRTGRPYVCEKCGKSPLTLPPDAPKALKLAPVGMRTVKQIEVNHKNKNIMDNDLANLQYLCSSCHKLTDNKVVKGKAIDDFGFLDGYEGLL